MLKTHSCSCRQRALSPLEKTWGEDLGKTDRGKDLPAEETERKQAQKECTERVVLKSFQILCRNKKAREHY